MGTGIKSDATAKSEKKANMIIPFMVYFDSFVRPLQGQAIHNKRCCFFV